MKLLTYLLFFLLADVAAAESTVRKPSVSYSERINCSDGSSRSGSFDLVYFNSEIPLGSTVSVRFGFEGVTKTQCFCNQFTTESAWANAATLPMKQWEDFGWMIRINREVACGDFGFIVNGIDFVVEIRHPSGSLLIDPTDHQGFQGYYRARIPNMSECNSMGSNSEKTCTTEVEWVNGR